MTDKYEAVKSRIGEILSCAISDGKESWGTYVIETSAQHIIDTEIRPLVDALQKIRSNEQEADRRGFQNSVYVCMTCEPVATNILASLGYIS